MALGKFLHEIDALPSDEFEEWGRFYADEPFDDFHRYHRPAALVATTQSQNRSDAIKNALDWLLPDAVLADVPDADQTTLAAFGLKLPGQR